MFAPPPKINSITIKSNRCEDLVNFYSDLGMLFHKRELNGIIYYSYKFDDFIFEIEEVNIKSDVTKNVKLKFIIDDISSYIDDIKEYGFEVVTPLRLSDLMDNITIRDYSNNLIELITYKT